MRRTPALLVTVAALGATLAACGSSTSPAAPTSSASAASGSASSGALSGTVEAGGSSTVGPLTTSIGDRYHAYEPGVTVNNKITSTGEGFKSFCNGDLDLVGASRAIEDAEKKACADKAIEPHQILVANDGITVVVPAAQSAVTCLTTAELKKLWEPAAANTVTSWKNVRDGLPDTKLVLHGPDKASGTLDFFTMAITGGEKQIRSDYAGHEDDMETVRGVNAQPGGVGFLGLSYLRENLDLIKGVSVDAGKGCVAPSEETVLDGSYTPLSRPLYIYVNAGRLKERPQAKAFVEYYVQWARNVAEDSNFVPVTESQRTQAKQQLADALK